MSPLISPLQWGEKVTKSRSLGKLNNDSLAICLTAYCELLSALVIVYNYKDQRIYTKQVDCLC